LHSLHLCKKSERGSDRLHTTCPAAADDQVPEVEVAMMGEMKKITRRRRLAAYEFRII
jgi:hypothetical protein